MFRTSTCVISSSPPSSVQPSIPSWFKDTIDKICVDGVPYLSVEEVQVTLDLSPKDVGRYAKTYAARSFSEGVLVGRELLSREFCRALSKRTDVSILDVGCGMAPFSLGVIHGLDRSVIEKDNACSVCLDLVDGNPFMLERARDFIAAREKICAYGVSSIRTKYEERKIVDVSDCFQKTCYDLILTSKFLGELVCRGRRDAFKDFLEESVQHIRVGGQIVLVEIPKHRELIESAVESLLKSGFRVAVRDIEVKPTFVGTESKDSEKVVAVFLTK